MRAVDVLNRVNTLEEILWSAEYRASLVMLYNFFIKTTGFITSQPEYVKAEAQFSQYMNEARELAESMRPTPVYATDALLNIKCDNPLELLRQYAGNSNSMLIVADCRDVHILEQEYSPEKEYKIDIWTRYLFNDKGAQFVVPCGINGLIVRAFYFANSDCYDYSHEQRDYMLEIFKNFLQREKMQFSITKYPSYTYEKGQKRQAQRTLIATLKEVNRAKMIKEIQTEQQ
ncbi:MAG: hypothetical protein HZB65_04355 [Candidatus Aenigmarchaeota archaeon]|nr:hypothetical protein [Candidatus Aenigmarchaeota archaeon]